MEEKSIGAEKNKIQFPEGVKIPENLEIKEVDLNNPFMREAAKLAVKNEFEGMTVTATLLVKDGKIIGQGINGDGFHQKTKTCLRADLPAGVGYEKCPGCHPDNHSERVAIRKAKENGEDLSGAQAYLYGHWWSCESCMQALVENGINTLYLLENAKKYFDRSNENSKNQKLTLERHIKEIIKTSQE